VGLELARSPTLAAIQQGFAAHFAIGKLLLYRCLPVRTPFGPSGVELLRMVYGVSRCTGEHTLTAVDAALGMVDVAHDPTLAVDVDLAGPGRADAGAGATTDALVLAELEDAAEVRVDRVHLGRELRRERSPGDRPEGLHQLADLRKWNPHHLPSDTESPLQPLPRPVNRRRGARNPLTITVSTTGSRQPPGPQSRTDQSASGMRGAKVPRTLGLRPA